MNLTTIDPPAIFEVVSHHFAVRFSQDLPLGELEKSGILLPTSLVNAINKRKRDFLVGRYCAHQALQKLLGTTSPPAVPIGEDDGPVWPKGIVGSLTHTREYAACALSFQADCRSIGLDSEHLVKLETAHKIKRMVLVDGEEKLGGENNFDQDWWITLIFSAKESIYKCLRPLVGRYFGFSQAQITTANHNDGTFSFRLLGDLNDEFKQGWEHQGKFSFHENLMHTAVELPHKR